MLLLLLEHLRGTACGYDAALGKITLRASVAAVVGLLLALALGPRLIRWLSRRFREPIKGHSAHLLRLHRNKQSTPTMGGLFLVAGLVGGVLLFGDLANAYVQAAVLLTLGLALVGAVDDLTKLRGKSHGLSARAKLFGQTAVALAAAVVVWQHHAALHDALQIRLSPFSPDHVSFSLGPWFIPLAVLVIVGASNAVNLTDGLDGLAGGCLVFATAAMGVVTYLSGHAELAQYLNLPRIPGAGEMTVVAGAMVGGLLGFLWFNCHPAQVFMGDTGSLPLGGLLGLLAVVARQEMLLVVIGGVFVVEAVSVILQVGWYKWRRRRIFLCAPLHHHFQFRGWPETRIVVRFWIAAAVFAILGVGSLKLHAVDPPSPPPAAACAFPSSAACAFPSSAACGVPSSAACGVPSSAACGFASLSPEHAVR
jgi:phospho-N-acetylmuramoyl-pentapeptide-transferase